MKGIQDADEFELQLIATGMHLSPEFGSTYKEIEKDGFKINNKVEMLLASDTPSSISKSTGLGIVGFTDAFSSLTPELLIVLGDRYEILAAALFERIPIAHIHGGETTEGAYDEAIRHSITKMSWWHFVATKEYQKRVIQLGENPNRVYLTGGMGVDCIKNIKLLSKANLESKIGFNFGNKNLLVTYHPVTLENETPERGFNELLNCLSKLDNTKIIFTLSNSDSYGSIINAMIKSYVEHNPLNAKVFRSMGQVNYLSTLQFVDGVVGNSSSGLLEAPTFKIGTVNIGNRQKGRIKAGSVIDCNPDQASIAAAIGKLYSNNFQTKLKSVKNPYGDGNASEKILKILINKSLPKDVKKSFHDL